MKNTQVQIFESQDGQAQLEVALDKETVWLSQEQMAELFDKAKSTINEHIKNVFKDGELEENESIRKFGNSDFSTKPTNFYNLDVIISVGYRVKSARGVQFRKWATRILQEHLVRGYTLNELRLKERGIEFEQALNLLSRTLSNQGLVSEEGEAVAQVISDYARSWSLVQGYDEQVLAEVGARQNGMQVLDPENAINAIQQLKKHLSLKGKLLNYSDRSVVMGFPRH
ncbi:virulence RhuM family protein [Idiomarina piscisalsi]|uniref:virulence RhuM family protein n=1 Tax=Idiomarina piscisalsi TaxID=1096243 RepID=UPI001F5436A3|nr:RhuM family protein [Idiomarina piscisalsi]